MTLKSLTLTEAPTTIMVDDFIVKKDAEYAEGSAYMYATGPGPSYDQDRELRVHPNSGILQLYGYCKLGSAKHGGTARYEPTHSIKT